MSHSEEEPNEAGETGEEIEEGPAIGPAYGRTILLVDDDEHILRSLTMYLESEDFDVRNATGGREALELVAKDPPDLVVLDVMMPEVDGFTVLTALKESPATAHIPVIMLTAKGQDQDVLRGYKLGAHAYMTKPVNYSELVDNIQLVFENEEMASAGGN